VTTLSSEIKSIRDIIIDEYQPEKIILFGSWSAGTARSDSDIDLMVISDKEQSLPRYKRGLDLRIKLSRISVPKDILFYTSGELNQKDVSKYSLIYKVLSEGKVLYDRKG